MSVSIYDLHSYPRPICLKTINSPVVENHFVRLTVHCACLYFQQTTTVVNSFCLVAITATKSLVSFSYLSLRFKLGGIPTFT